MLRSNCQPIVTLQEIEKHAGVAVYWQGCWIGLDGERLLVTSTAIYALERRGYLERPDESQAFWHATRRLTLKADSALMRQDRK